MSGNLIALAQPPEFRVIEANGAAERMFDASIEPILGASSLAVLERHGGLGALHESIRGAMSTNEACNAHVRFVVDGRIVERQITFGQTRADEDPPVIRIMVADRETAQAGNDLPQIDALVDVISHEMRSPLNAVLTWASLLELDPTPATIEKAAAVIRDSVHAQARLIDDLIELFAPWRRNPPSEEAVDVCELVVQSLADAQASFPLAVTADAIVSSEPAMVSGDWTRLERAFRHLIRNAAAAMRDGGGNIIARVTLDADNVIVTVTDQGTGMSADQIGNTFRSFGRQDRRRSGAGLGLSVVRTIIDQHGGCVCARSGGPGAGSAFTLSLPIRHG